ncbi:unnamed protein product [Rhizoctonia solani]|uniref:Lipase 2 n=1 Tax=Rhizoctonia solani TaxID=456999 RepID=A0A8H3BCT0_9AGAM|nr:unnamed protein product [Rhizoctonia solani]
MRMAKTFPQDSNIDGLPNNPDQGDRSSTGKNVRGTKLGISTTGLERLPSARVTTPSADSPGQKAETTATTSRTKPSSNEAGRTGRVQITYAPSAIESLQDALSEDLTSSIHQRSPSSASSIGMPPSFLSPKTPRFLDGLTRTTMPTASLSVPPRAYLHTPIPSPFRDTARATAQTEALLNPPVAASQSAIVSRRSESPLKAPTFLAPTRSSLDTLRGTLQRSDSMHTSASHNKSFSSWWFGDNKKDVDKLLDESDRAETAEEERDGFRSKYLTPHNPIVFCHGLFGFDTITLGPSFAPLSIPHWRGISEVLAAAGADVLVTRVPATSAVPARAAVLRKKISEVYPGRDIHLIGHSMGGLDCRYLVHELMKEAESEGGHKSTEEAEYSTSVQRGGEYRREGGPERTADEEDKLALAAELKRKGLPPFRVLSVTTIATPHRGSAFADYFLSTLGRQNIPGFASLMDKLPIGGGDGKAFESLTLDSMRRFNEETPDDPNVHYFSWGSKFEPGVFDALGFGFSHKIIMQKEGPNDGLVSVKSARFQRGGEYRREGGPERTADEEDKLALAAELKRKGLPPFRVLSLTTIATPHRGSAFADFFLSTLGRQNIPGFVSLMEKLPIGGGDGKAFESLTLDSMRQFNEETPDDPNVHYFSWGSKFEPGVLDALGFGFSHKIIMQKEGPNDGLVSVKSARWGTYLGTLDGVNHLELVGWVNEARNTITEWMGGEANFRPATFYLGVANHLAEAIEGQERRTNDVLDPGAQLVKEPESIQGMSPEKSLPKKQSASFQSSKKKVSVDSRGRTIED